MLARAAPGIPTLAQCSATLISHLNVLVTGQSLAQANKSPVLSPRANAPRVLLPASRLVEPALTWANSLQRPPLQAGWISMLMALKQLNNRWQALKRASAKSPIPREKPSRLL